VTLPLTRPVPVAPGKAPPAHLRAATRRWWTHLVNEYSFEEPDYPLLEAACVAWDRATQAREAIKRSGAYQETKSGLVRAHPGIRVEKDALLAFERLLRALNLDIAPPDSRPPSRVRR
jgi:P27 family predicted phage terminase small subunit